MRGLADLHIHTIHSDGRFTVDDIFAKAQDLGLKAISITDHDTVEGCRVANSCKKKYPIEFVNGIEFSCFQDGREYHVLGYFIDIENSILHSHLAEFRKARLKRAENILRKLHKIDLPLSLEEIIEQAGEAPLARPHIALAMMDKGYTSTFKEAFNLYIGEGKPAYEAKTQFSIERAIQLINHCNGIAVLAHPSRTISQEGLYKMIQKGLDGIEVVHPMHDKELQKFYHKIATQYWLIETGGSDFHGTRDYDEGNFGKFTVSAAVVDSMRVHVGNKF